jgi:Sulfotransferase domain
VSKIFGVGWAKTGTTTLGTCFEILGFNHQSQDLTLVEDLAKNDLSRILALAEEKETFEDWPWIILYEKLDRVFPNSRFILTKRDPEKWIRSYDNMIRNQGNASEELNEIRRILYDLPFPYVSKEQLIKRYERHNEEVIRYFYNRPQALLVLDWEKGDGWKELCKFLDKDIPNMPFPHTNKGDYAIKAIFKRIQNSLRKQF